MNRRSRIITFVIAAALSYGSLYAFVGPEKVKSWHKERHHYHGYHHDHHDHGYHQDDQSKLYQSENHHEEL